MRFALSLSSLFLSATLAAQPNTISGVDVNAYDVGSLDVEGRRGSSYPNGEVGMAFGHSFCNSGSVNIDWVRQPRPNPMSDDYPKIAFLLVRESNGRMVQVSGRSFLKHSRVPYNFNSGPCRPCTHQFGSPYMSIGCSDTYSPNWNGNRIRLGPPEEIDPWLGTFDSQGSYFDRGDPAVGGAGANDNLNSLTESMVGQFDAVKNRVIVRESDIVAGGSFYAQIQLIIKGESVLNRHDNIQTRPVNFIWSGGNWNRSSTTGSSVNGSALYQWNGATHALEGNGIDDGRFLVAVRVTEPVPGTYHYEYAVHNIDNDRGGAVFRIPCPDSATVSNVGFHDVDQNSGNDWSYTHSGGELTFNAGAGNALDWNNIFNFWFDCSLPPTDGVVTIDQARPGPGQARIDFMTRIPDGRPVAAKRFVGASCGSSPGMSIDANPLPVLGATVNLSTSGIPSGTTFGATLVWFQELVPAIDLTLIGMTNCAMHGIGDNLNLPFVAPGSTYTQPLALPNDPNIAGAMLVAQTFTAGAASNPLGVAASNGVVLTLGRQP